MGPRARTHGPRRQAGTTPAMSGRATNAARCGLAPVRRGRLVAARRRDGERRWFAVLATALIAASSCSTSPRGTPRPLPSGRTIDVVWSGVLGESNQVWALKYWSRLPVQDPAGLHDEAAEVWATVQGEAEASGATRASLWPLNLDSHFLHFDGWRPVYITVHSPEFSYERVQDGTWKRLAHAR